VVSKNACNNTGQHLRETINVPAATLVDRQRRLCYLLIPGRHYRRCLALAQSVVALTQCAAIVSPRFEKPMFHVEHPPVQEVAAKSWTLLKQTVKIWIHKLQRQ